MYYSRQPITTCSDQSQQKFSNVPSFLVCAGFAPLTQKQWDSSFSFYFLLFFIASILASLVW